MSTTYPTLRRVVSAAFTPAAIRQGRESVMATTNLLGNGLLALLRHPRPLARLRREPALMLRAVEEMLRYESPADMVARITREPWVIGDLEVPAGEVLYCMIGAANHDAAVLDDPDRFDVGRTTNPQLSFGGGVHCCIGAPLARLQAEVAFAALLERCPSPEPADPEPQWRPMITVRGLKAPPVRATSLRAAAAT